MPSLFLKYICRLKNEFAQTIEGMYPSQVHWLAAGRSKQILHYLRHNPWFSKVLRLSTLLGTLYLKV